MLDNRRPELYQCIANSTLNVGKLWFYDLYIYLYFKK